MPLTTIDGVLCIPQKEFKRFTSFLVFREYALTAGNMCRSQRDAEEELGAKSRNYQGSNGSGVWWSASHSAFSYLSDEWLIQEIYKAIQPGAARDARCKVGDEEDIDGNVWVIPEDAKSVAADLSYYFDNEGNRHDAGYADLALIGPASLGGKIVLELCQRLAQEVYRDDTAAGYTRRILTDIPQVATPPENDISEKECFYHGQNHEPHHADG